MAEASVPLRSIACYLTSRCTCRAISGAPRFARLYSARPQVSSDVRPSTSFRVNRAFSWRTFTLAARNAIAPWIVDTSRMPPHEVRFCSRAGYLGLLSRGVSSAASATIATRWCHSPYIGARIAAMPSLTHRRTDGAGGRGSVGTGR